MTRYRFSRPPARPAPAAPPVATRRILWIVLAIVAAGVVIGLLVRGGGSGDAAGRTAGDDRSRPDRDLGPAGRALSHGRHLPSAADVLGVLHGTAGGLIHVEGHVKDAVSREAVGDVEVVFSSQDGETTATADADGSYAIDVAAGDYRAFVRGDYVISVGPAPYERLPAPPDPLAASAPDTELAPSITIASAQKGVDLEVQRSGVVEGKVVDATGRPVVGAIVRARVGAWRPVLGTDVAESAADGSFRLEVPTGYYNLDAAHPDFAGPTPYGAEPPNVMVYAQMSTSVTLTLARGCIVEGRTVHRDGTPVGAGALERQGPEEFYPAGPIGDDGTFRYSTIDTGDVTIRAWPWKSPPTDPQTIECREGVRRQIQFVVPDRTPDLVGTIADAAGVAQPGAYIDVYAQTQGGMNQQERADDQGNWAVYALPAGDYTITAFVPGHGVATGHARVPGPSVALRLSGTGSLTGSVEGLGDGDTFQLSIAGCVADGAQVIMPPTTRLVPIIGGTYRVDDLPACHLIAQAKGPSRSVMIERDIAPGGAATFDIDLTPPRAKTVHVTVVEQDGRPVVGAQVMVSRMDGSPATGDLETTDGAGSATVDAHVGDVIRVFIGDGNGHARSGEYEVSDAMGTDETARVTLDPTPDF